MSTKAGNLVECVQETIRRFAMFGRETPILLAISGGPDSMCLLHSLLDLSYPVEVAHFDHQTRDGASKDDAAFVRDVAESLSLPLREESRPIATEAAETRLSFEEYARQARYEFLIRVAKERGCRAIATGHHADDQVETVLMRLLRGTTPRGLAGIPPVRELDEIRVARPLFRCTRNEIMHYLDEHAITYRTDQTNSDTEFQRNRVRHELIPHLAETYNPRLREAVMRFTEVQRDENSLLDALAERTLAGCLLKDGALSRAAFAEFHPALQRRVVLLFAWRHGVDCPFDRVEAVREFIAEGPAGRSCDLGGGVSLRNSRKVTEVFTAPRDGDDIETALAVPGRTVAFGKWYDVHPLSSRPSEPLAEYCSATRQVFDADALGERLSIRHRRPGDRFTPYGMSGSKKLKDYFADMGMATGERASQPLLMGGERIAWIVGHAINGCVAVTDRTERLVEVEVSDAVK